MLNNKPPIKFIILFSSLVISLFLFLLVFLSNSNPIPHNDHNQDNSNLSDNYVTDVIDGDTFRLASGETIRLLCVDTPEKGHEGYDDAKDFLEDAILYREVNLVSSVTDKDAYNRSLRYVYINDSFINQRILDTGYGTYFRIPPETCGRVK